MDHIAIDLGGRESQVCIRKADGSIVREQRVKTKSLPHLLAEQASPCRVIVETSAEAFAIADAALEAGHQVKVVPATLVTALGVGERRTKTDRRDAQKLSEVSCCIELPSVHIPSKPSRALKSMCAGRDAMIRSRTLLINSVRGFLRTQLRKLEIQKGSPAQFPDRVRDALPEMPEWVERMVLVIEELNAQLLEADKELAAVAKQDAVCKRLMTVPGVGPITAVLFTAVLDQIDRFPSAHKVQSYLGLTPGEDSSSDRKRRTSITKAGSAAARRVLVQAAWAARRTKSPQPMVAWSLEVEKRRGKNIAVIALARKMAGILFALWRDGTEYSAEFKAPLTQNC